MDYVLDVEVLLHVGDLLPDRLDEVVVARNVRGHHRELLPVVSEMFQGIIIETFSATASASRDQAPV